MKKQIKIEEIRNYFGTDLDYEVDFDGKNALLGLNTDTLDVQTDLPSNQFFGTVIKNSIDDIEPIVRPLSQLVEEIEHNGEIFVPINVIGKLFPEVAKMLLLAKQKTLNIEEIPYQIMKMLFEWHFDVFWWIEKGLAIKKK